MSVWLCLPARRDRHESSIPTWLDAGYKVAVMREPELPLLPATVALPISHYPGWARCVNVLSQIVFLRDPECNWIVACGDDQYPDPNKKPEEIAEELTEHFDGTFGVCQPIGDQRMDSLGHIAPRVAGSPWLGRDFCLRMYHGAGPLYPGFYHNHADEHLQEVSKKLGCFWQRDDLTHRHDHWAYKRGSREDCPDWAIRLHTPERWKESSALFQKLKASGFREADDLLPALSS